MTRRPGELLALESEALAPGYEPLAADGSAGEREESQWLGFCLCHIRQICERVRDMRFGPLNSIIQFKADGSPVSELELDIESTLRDQLRAFAPKATLVGEEGGGSISADGLTLAVDPIDGTWAFVNRSETFTTTLAMFRGDAPMIGLVASAATGEIAYAARGRGARLIQLGLGSSEHLGYDLPLEVLNRPQMLVNVHPAREIGPFLNALIHAWKDGEVQMVKATGGSPVWSMMDAVKSGGIYVNLWSGSTADAYDLAAGRLIVDSAGGSVVDLHGRTIPHVGHQGTFLAGTDDQALQRIAAVLRNAGV